MPRGGKRQGAGRKSTKLQSNVDGSNGSTDSSVAGSQQGEETGLARATEDSSGAESLQSIRSNSEIKKESKDSNQNEPKEIIKEESNKLVLNHGICKGQSISEISGSLNEREIAGSSSNSEGNLRRDSSCEHHESSQGSSRDLIHGDTRGELHVKREGIEEAGKGGLLVEQVHTSSAGGSTSASEHPEQQRIAAGSNGEALKLSIDDQIRLLRNPIHFGQTFCASHEYVQWQRDFLRDIQVVRDDGKLIESDWPRTVVLAAVNGSGKTEILADAIRILSATVPNCLIAITSPIYRQLEMLESYLKAQNHKFPGWTCIEGKLTAPNGNIARWFATDTATAVESFHAPFLVRIIEEAKALKDDFWDQTNRWQPKLTIIVSSKGLTSGRFYEALTKHRTYNRIHEVDATMCPWIPTKWINEQIAQHGRDSSIIKSMILNEFSDEGVNNLISLEQIRHCFKYPPPWRNPGFRVAGIDLSSNRINGDKTICVARQGNKLFEPYELPPCKTAEAIGLITNWLKREKIKIAFVDSSGHGGISIYEMLCENMAGDESIQIHGVNFGSDALSEQTFCKNRATELWVNGQKKIEKLDLIFEWTEKWRSQFITEVTGREVRTLSSGERMLQSKKDMNYSPDLSDATFLSLIEPAYETKSPTGLGKTYWKDYKDDSNQATFGRNSNGRSLGRG